MNPPGSEQDPVRCAWAASDPLLARYHDQEWGVTPERDEDAFAALLLETFQSGLSFRVVLAKRDGLRAILHRFDPERLAASTAAERERWLSDPRGIRHRGKLHAATVNARAYLALRAANDTLLGLLQRCLAGEERAPALPSASAVPVETPAARSAARALKARGFRFVGPRTVLSTMQATGVVDHHEDRCFKRTATQEAA